jgi:hypothetical protein
MSSSCPCLCKSSSQQQQSPVPLLTLHEEYVPHDVSALLAKMLPKVMGKLLEFVKQQQV